MMAAGRQVYSELKNLIVWVKSNAGMGSFYRSRHELVFVWKNGAAPHLNNFELGQYGRSRTNVWEYAGASSFGGDRLEQLASHPTSKPVVMLADAIRDCSRRGDLVLDPFAGSGSTLIATERTGRKARVLELDPHYCDVIVRRWQAATGPLLPEPTLPSMNSRIVSSPLPTSMRHLLMANAANAAGPTEETRPGANSNYQVGYGRPPAGSRFKKGTSGNPRGRPKHSKNMKTIIREALTSPVTVREGERTRRVPKIEGIVLRQVEAALKGDEKAAITALKMAAQVGLLEETVGAEILELSPQENLLVNEALAQLQGERSNSERPK